MKNSNRVLLSLLIFWLVSPAFAQLFPNLGGQRAGISGLTFLKNDLSPRSVGMGGASVAISGDGFANHANIASASDVKDYRVAAGNLLYSAGLNQQHAAVFIPSTYATWTVAVNSLTTGNMEERTEFQPFGTGRYFRADCFYAGVGYSRQLSDKFSFGIFTKYIREQIASFNASTLGVDLGFMYKTDFKDLRFAVALENFGPNSSLKGGDQAPVDFNRRNGVTVDNYPLPTLFKMGVSMVPIKHEDYSLLTSVQLNHPNDNAENIRLGAEFNYKDLLFARAGYKVSVAGQTFPTMGVGVEVPWGRYGLRIDYGANPTNYLGIQHMIGVSLAIDKPTKESASTTTNE